MKQHRASDGDRRQRHSEVSIGGAAEEAVTQLAEAGGKGDVAALLVELQREQVGTEVIVDDLADFLPTFSDRS